MKLTPEFVEHEYHNRARCPDHPKAMARWAELSAAACARLSPRRDLRYGPRPKETLDLFVPAGARRGVFAFIHGGYWRALDKSDFSYVAAPFVERGIAVAVVNYDLCPQVSVATIVEECRAAVVWLAREAGALGIGGAPLVVGGHSAGGQLAATMLAVDWGTAGLDADPLAGAVSLSGVHDLAPIPLFSFNSDIRLDEAEARRLSPVNMTPRSSAPLLLAAGADETSEFLRQTRLLWDAWPANRPRGATAPLFVPARDHFTVVLDYASADSELTRQTLALFPSR
jgi:arylformamidase